MRHDVFGKAFELTHLVRTAKPDDDRLSTGCHKIFDPSCAGVNRAKAYALALGHDIKWGMIVAFDEVAQFLLGLSYIVIDVEGGVDGSVEVMGCDTGLLGKAVESTPLLRKCLRRWRIGEPTVAETSRAA